MKKVLYINGNPQKEEESFSRQTARYYINELKKRETATEIIEFNVYEEYLPFIDEDVLSGWAQLAGGASFEDLSEEQISKISRMGEILQLFKEADEYVIASPLWNFSITPKLKAFIDNVTIAGETFKYTENGPIGLLKDKKALIVQASGGSYREEPMLSIEHGSKYLETVLAFIGIENIRKVYAENIAYPNITHEDKLKAAFKQVDELKDLDLV